MQAEDNNSNGKDKTMKKTPNNEATIESLYKDYKDRQQKATTEAGALKQILAEDDKRITALTDKVNASVSSMTEEEYIATCKALENEKLTKEMHEKQLKEKAEWLKREYSEEYKVRKWNYDIDKDFATPLKRLTNQPTIMADVCKRWEEEN